MLNTDTLFYPPGLSKSAFRGRVAKANRRLALQATVRGS